MSIAHRYRPIDRRPSASAICEKRARLLKLHLVLAFHIAKKLDGGLPAGVVPWNPSNAIVMIVTK